MATSWSAMKRSCQIRKKIETTSLTMKAPTMKQASAITRVRSLGSPPRRSPTWPRAPASTGAPAISCIIGSMASTPSMSRSEMSTEPTNESASLRRVSGAMSSPMPSGKPITPLP